MYDKMHGGIIFREECGMLIEADLVRSRREGKRTYYSLNRGFFRDLNNRMQEICRKDSGPGAPEGK